MGKNYYCEYCDKLFRDVLAVRKTHLNSARHQQMKKEHFDQFRDIDLILKEESVRQPCPRLLKNLDCNFGSRCRFSHLMPWDLQAIEESHKEENQKLAKKRLEDLKEQPVDLPNLWKNNEIQVQHNDSLPPSLRKWTKTSFESPVTQWGT